LSDHAREWVAYIQSVHQFLEVFSLRYFSFELQQTKQNSATFIDVLLRLKRKPGDCLFIDDSNANIERARSLGIASIHFTTAHELVSELATFGIVV